MTDTLRATPRLASDITRSWVAISAFVAAIVAATAVAIALRVDLDDPEMLTSAMSGVFAMSWALFCTVMAIITVATFVRASGPELRAWLAATAAPVGRWRRFWWSLNGGGAIWWALSGSAVALYVLVDLAVSGRATHPVFVGAGIATVPASVAIIIVSFAVSHARHRGDHDPAAPRHRVPQPSRVRVQRRHHRPAGERAARRGALSLSRPPGNRRRGASGRGRARRR